MYDLGLSVGQRVEVGGWRGVEIRELPWGSLPAHARYLNVYAWKVFVWADAAARDGVFLFIDACAELRQPPRLLFFRLFAQGYFLTVQAEATPANIRRDSQTLTHPAMLAKLDTLRNGAAGSAGECRGHSGECAGHSGECTGHKGECVGHLGGCAGHSGEGGSARGGDGVHCMAGLVGFDAACARTQEVLAQLVGCASDPECIAPLGATLLNHRFEQAALSVLARAAGMICDTNPAFWGYMNADGTPSVPLDANPTAPGQDQVVFARRRHPHKPYRDMVQRANDL